MAAVPLLTACALLLGLAGAGTAAAAPAASELITTERLIVKYRGNDGPRPAASAERTVQAAAGRRGVSTRHLRRMASGAHVFQFSRRLSLRDAALVAQAMRAADPSVEYVEPDLLLQAAQDGWSPADPMFNQQWHLFDATAGVRAAGAWARGRGSGTVVAVIDTGVRPHPDLLPNLVPGIDFVSDPAIAADGDGRDGNATDPGDAVAAGACGSGSAAAPSSWHGTHVAGIVAAATNTIGVVGVAPAARILPLRALGRCGGYTSDIADAITWAAGGSVAGIAPNPTPARVINLSLGGRANTCPITLHDAIQAARSRGAVVVAAAGNANADAGGATPANCAGVITVAATGPTGAKASYSNAGAVVALAAPGGDGSAGILSTANAGLSGPGLDNYRAYKGTSMAAPVVSGVAALLLSARPSLSPDEVAALLKGTAAPFGGACGGCGSGIVDAAAAVAALAAQPAPAPAPADPPAAPPLPPGTVREIEPNNTRGQAQPIGGTAITVAGTLTRGDVDHFLTRLPAGGRLSVSLTPAPQTAAGLGVLLGDGRPLLTMPGGAGAKRSVVISNSGRAPVEIVLRVVLSGGPPGSYTLDLKP